MSRLDQLTGALAQSGLGRWYQGRETYEQYVVSGVTLLCVFALLWAFLWKPIADWQLVEQNRYQNASQLLDWMRANEAELKASGRSPNARGSKPLVPIITRAATEHGIRLDRLQPDSNNVISVNLQGQSFNQIITWLAQLEENNGVSVERASFDQQAQSGYVNANLRLN